MRPRACRGRHQPWFIVFEWKLLPCKERLTCIILDCSCFNHTNLNSARSTREKTMPPIYIFESINCLQVTPTVCWNKYNILVIVILYNYIMIKPMMWSILKISTKNISPLDTLKLLDTWYYINELIICVQLNILRRYVNWM